MARSRRRRRRQSLTILAALVVTVALLVFARDVHRLAFASTSHQAALNETFGSLATTIMGDEDRLGLQAADMLEHAPTLTRPDLAGRIQMLDTFASQIDQDAALLSSPPIHANLQRILITVTDERTDAVEALGALLENRLQLGSGGHGTTVALIGSELSRAGRTWSTARHDLVHQPGHVVLKAGDFPLTHAPLASEVAIALAASKLAVHHSASLDAVEATPAPFPGHAGTWTMIPTHALSISVAVSNDDYVVQPLTVVVTLTTMTGHIQSRSNHVIMGPLGSRAIALAAFGVAPGEHATVRITVTGAPPATGSRLSLSEQLIVSPDPTG